MKLVEAQNIPDWGGAFRKPRGEYVYLRVSKASAKFFGLDENFVYGVTFNGNMTRVPLKQQVVQMSLKSMLQNVETTETWERNVCNREPSEEE